jgi:hypothetical protein
LKPLLFFSKTQVSQLILGYFPQKKLGTGVAEKHNFRGIQRKILQVSDFAKKMGFEPPPHGDTAADIAKIGFRIEKHDFCKNPIGFLRNSPD